MINKGQQKNDRSRVLNIIYFIDAKKTRSFSIPLPRLAFITILILATCIWSLFSVYNTKKNQDKITTLERKYESSLTTIFEYQSKYDHVYEIAYPSKLISLNPENINVNEAKKGESQNIDNEETKDNRKKYIHLHSLFKQDLVELKLETKNQSLEDWPIALENIKLSVQNQQTTINFSIKNKISPEKSKGHLWAIITFIDNLGNKKKVAAPKALDLDEVYQSEIDNNKLEFYSIRYYKAKSLVVESPFKNNFIVSHVDIRMKDLDNKIISFSHPIRRLPENGTLNSTNKESKAYKGGEIATKSKPYENN